MLLFQNIGLLCGLLDVRLGLWNIARLQMFFVSGFWKEIGQMNCSLHTWWHIGFLPFKLVDKRNVKQSSAGWQSHGTAREDWDICSFFSRLPIFHHTDIFIYLYFLKRKKRPTAVYNEGARNSQKQCCTYRDWPTADHLFVCSTNPFVSK